MQLAWIIHKSWWHGLPCSNGDYAKHPHNELHHLKGQSASEVASKPGYNTEHRHIIIASVGYHGYYNHLPDVPL